MLICALEILNIIIYLFSEGGFNGLWLSGKRHIIYWRDLYVENMFTVQEKFRLLSSFSQWYFLSPLLYHDHVSRDFVSRVSSDISHWLHLAGLGLFNHILKLRYCLLKSVCEKVKESTRLICSNNANYYISHANLRPRRPKVALNFYFWPPWAFSRP